MSFILKEKKKIILNSNILCKMARSSPVYTTNKINFFQDKFSLKNRTRKNKQNFLEENLFLIFFF